ncbi:histone methylation DOT1 [Schizophyllum commune]
MKIMRRLFDEVISPFSLKLRGTGCDTRQAYGEMEPAFVCVLLNEGKLTRQSRFVDLGSGVGSVVVQAAIHIGCSAYGIEIRDDLAQRAEHLQLKARELFAGTGAPLGDITLEQGDMLTSATAAERVAEADLVFVNNAKFGPELNHAIVHKLLLRMRSGSYVISLDEFLEVSRTRQGTPRYMVDSDRGTVLEVIRRPYPEGAVSWTSSANFYYFHRIYRADADTSEFRGLKQAFDDPSGQHILQLG